MLFLSRYPTNRGLMHTIGVRKFSCVYQETKEVDFFQLKRSYIPFKTSWSLFRIRSRSPYLNKDSEVGISSDENPIDSAIRENKLHCKIVPLNVKESGVFKILVHIHEF